MKLTNPSVFILGFYIALLMFWITTSVYDGTHVSFSHIAQGFKGNQRFGYIFAFLYGFVPLFGGGFGLRLATKWGLFKSSMGRAMFCLGLGLFCWGIGELIWSYYNFILNTTVPYPAWSDAGFVSFCILWTIGIFYLGPATGVKFALRNIGGKIILIFAPLIVLAGSWYIQVVIARGGSITSGGRLLKIFFDIAYPVDDVLILTFAFLIFGLSFKYLGGRFKWPILITLFGVFVEYLADFGYTYTTTINTFYNGGWVDLLYTTALFIMSFGVCLLDAREPAAAPSQ